MEDYKLENYFKEFKKSLEIWASDYNPSKLIITNLNEILHIPKEGVFFTNIYNSLDKMTIDLVNTNKGFEIILKNLNGVEFSLCEQMYLIWNSEQRVDICSI